MITKHIKYVFVYFFTCYFLLAGAGFNVVKYCCQACADKGIEAVAVSSCFAVHQHSHAHHGNHDSDIVCSNPDHQPENCHLLRLSTDTPLYQYTARADVQSVFLPDLFIPVDFLLCTTKEFDTSSDLPPPDNILPRTGRTILSLHAVLLI